MGLLVYSKDQTIVEKNFVVKGNLLSRCTFVKDIGFALEAKHAFKILLTFVLLVCVGDSMILSNNENVDWSQFF